MVPTSPLSDFTGDGENHLQQSSSGRMVVPRSSASAEGGALSFKGYNKYMIGVDEVGRGCLAGPLLVVAARAYDELPQGLKDSKLLSRKQREEILDLLSMCCNFGQGWVKASEIDFYGLSKALRLGAQRALRNLQVEIEEEIVLDGSFNYLPKKFKNSRALINGDNLLPIISAASIYAKVTRDRFMINLANRYPNYSFEHHVGYGTKTHMLALNTHGAIKYVHRSSFMPVANLAGA